MLLWISYGVRLQISCFYVLNHCNIYGKKIVHELSVVFVIASSLMAVNFNKSFFCFKLKLLEKVIWILSFILHFPLFLPLHVPRCMRAGFNKSYPSWNGRTLATNLSLSHTKKNTFDLYFLQCMANVWFTCLLHILLECNINWYHNVYLNLQQFSCTCHV